MTRSISSDTYKRFRELLIKQRRKVGLSQVNLANQLGRPQQFVSRYEIGDRRIDVGEFLEIADCLNLDAVNLIAELNSWRKRH